MSWLNGQVSPDGRLLGVTVKNGVDALSTKNCISFCVQTIPYAWNAVSFASPPRESVPRPDARAASLCRVDRGVVASGARARYPPAATRVSMMSASPQSGPFGGSDVASQRPERRPQALVCGIRRWMLASRIP